MPKFILYEERHEVYTITVEAKNREDAKQLYEAGNEPIDQWKPESSNGSDFVCIVELNEAGERIEEHLIVNGEFDEEEET